jgi:hypothetical protein
LLRYAESVISFIIGVSNFPGYKYLANVTGTRCRCSAGEEKLNITEGVLKKSLKTKEQKEKELEEVVNVYTFNS